MVRVRVRVMVKVRVMVRVMVRVKVKVRVMTEKQTCIKCGKPMTLSKHETCNACRTKPCAICGVPTNKVPCWRCLRAGRIKK